MKQPLSEQLASHAASMFARKHNSIDIDRISVASPCPASWEAMRGDDRSRHCGDCGLDVYNISGLTRKEAAELISGRRGRMCIRMHRRADGTVLTRDCPRGLRAYRLRVAKFAGSVFAAMLGLFSVGYAQRFDVRDSRGVRSETFVDAAMIEGVVRDPNGVPIGGALITVTTSTGRKIERKADKKGHFQLTDLSLDKGKNRIEIAADYFRSFKDEFTIRRREMINYPVALEVGDLVGIIDFVTERDRPIDMQKSSVSTKIHVGDN